MLYLVTSDSLNGQTNKISLISFLIQTKCRINYLIFECNYRKPSWGSLQWIFIKWLLLWANLVTLNFYDAIPVVNTVESTTSERSKWVCGWPAVLQKSFFCSVLLQHSSSRRHFNYYFSLPFLSQASFIWDTQFQVATLSTYLN